MTMPKLENRWTIGNLLTILGMFASVLFLTVTLSIAWGKLTSEIEAIAMQGLQTAATIETVRTESAGRERRVQALENVQGRTDERLINLIGSVNELKAAQTETNQLLRQLVPRQ